MFFGVTPSITNRPGTFSWKYEKSSAPVTSGRIAAPAEPDAHLSVGSI